MKIRLYRQPDLLGAEYSLHGECQDEVTLVEPLLVQRGERWSFHLLSYAACILLFLRQCEVTVQDCRPTNMGIGCRV